jgi:hypothetical protein
MDGIEYDALREAFPPAELEWRVQQSGDRGGRVWALVVPYVTNRAIQTRLDDVAGPENWANEFRQGPGGGVLCGLSLRVGAEWVTKWDGAENTDVEGVKGGLSGAMKRAAVQWGIGRYLYGLDELFARVHDGGRFRSRLSDRAGGRPFRWDPPPLPAALLPPTAGDGRTLESMLAYLRSAGASVPDGIEFTVRRRTRDLRGFVREHWSTIREEPRVARLVADAVAAATGIPYAERPADPQRRVA